MTQPQGHSADSFWTRQLNWGFRQYVRRFIGRNFNAVRIANMASLIEAPRRPLICFVNHPGWWDPMAAVLITDELLTGRRFFAPMDAVALRHYPILERVGFFPLERDTVGGTREFLRRSRAILEDDQAVLWLTPTGRFTDVRERAPFMGGLGHLSMSPSAISLLPVAVEYTFWNERRPELLIEFGDVIDSTELPSDKLARTSRLEEELDRVQTSLAEKAVERDPHRFTTVVTGAAGVGGWYDGYRRMFAWMSGSPFQSRHEFEPAMEPQTSRSPGE